MGSTYFKDPVRKVQITREANGTLIYSYPKWEDRDYKEHQNLLPLPQSEVDKNKTLVQNPGY